MDLKLCVFVLLLICSKYANAYGKYNYKTLYFKQKVDHFSFTDKTTFSQRYLFSDEHWNSTSGPIFFYAGNEGDITIFAQNTGFMWEIAPEFKAMVIFAEHRYYGKSMPFGKMSLKNATYAGYLTSTQALADYAQLLTFVRTAVTGAANSTIVAFGGSYGGMLSAWFRMKYPHIVQGAIAASAPILQFLGMTPCYKFGEVVTKDYALESKECVEVIRKSWSALNTIYKRKGGAQWIEDNWKLCKPLKNEDDFKSLKDYLVDVWTNLAMVDYPYPTSFLAPLPAHPVKMVCNYMKHPETKDEDILKQVFEGLNIYFNFTKTSKCLAYHEEDASQLGEKGWDFQSCTEMIMPFCYDGKKDFFEPTNWNLTTFGQECYKRWGAMPSPLLTYIEYGGRHISAASNIVFSNGLLDPWSTGGILKNMSSSLIAVIIPEGAHHLDLRQSDPNDPPGVIAARKLEKHYIYKWIEEYRQSLQV